MVIYTHGRKRERGREAENTRNKIKEGNEYATVNRRVAIKEGWRAWSEQDKEGEK